MAELYTMLSRRGQRGFGIHNAGVDISIKWLYRQSIQQKRTFAVAAYAPTQSLGAVFGEGWQSAAKPPTEGNKENFLAPQKRGTGNWKKKRTPPFAPFLYLPPPLPWQNETYNPEGYLLEVTRCAAGEPTAWIGARTVAEGVRGKRMRTGRRLNNRLEPPPLSPTSHQQAKKKQRR